MLELKDAELKDARLEVATGRQQLATAREREAAARARAEEAETAAALAHATAGVALPPQTPATPAPLLAPGPAPVADGPAAAAAAASSAGGSETAREGALIQLAAQQAQRDAQLGLADRERAALQRELEARAEAEAALRGKLRDSVMRERREGMDATYVKCLVLKFLTMDEAGQECLFPALATCLQLSEDEVAEVGRTLAARVGGARRLLRSLLGGGGGGAVAASGVTSRGGADAGAAALRESRAELQGEVDELRATRDSLVGELRGERDACRARAEAEGVEARSALSRAEVESARLLSELEAERGRAARESVLLQQTQAELGSLSTLMSTQLREAESAARGSRESVIQAEEHAYLRNVLQRYMETEDHEALFPVIAMCIRLSAEEVEAIRQKRSAAASRRAGAGGRLRSLLLGV
jgi:hypothetical protein